MTPALLKRTSNLSDCAKNSFAEVLIVERSARSRERKTREPVEWGERNLMVEMAVRAFFSERAAMKTRACWE